MSWVCTWILQTGEVVVSVDAKSGIQAQDRAQPLPPIDFGKTRKWTFEYKRMGATVRARVGAR